MSWNSDGDMANVLNRFVTLISWFTQPGAGGGAFTIDKVRMTLAEWDENVAPRLGSLETDVRTTIERDIVPRLEVLRAKHRLLFCSILHEALEVRIPWAMADGLAALPAKIAAIRSQGSQEQVDFAETATRELLGCGLDPTEMFRTIESRCEEGEAKWKKIRAELRCDWNEEFTPDMERRLMGNDVPDLIAWRREMAAEVRAIQERHPELR